eukprot:13597308-Alexandrium_andersonii.AAC.1
MSRHPVSCVGLRRCPCAVALLLFGSSGDAPMARGPRLPPDASRQAAGLSSCASILVLPLPGSARHHPRHRS